MIEPHRDRVDGLRKRATQSYLADILAIVIAWRPAVDGKRQVIRCTVRCQAAFNCCKIDKRLEGRTRLAARFHGTIELALCVIAAADKRANAAVVVEQDDGRLANAQRFAMARK